MTNERGIPLWIKEIIAREKQVEGLEATNPILKEIIEMRNVVALPENKVNSDFHTVDRRRKDKAGYVFVISDRRNGIFTISEGASEHRDGRQVIKNQITYYGNGMLELLVDSDLVDPSIYEALEEPGESKLYPTGYSHKTRGEVRNAITVEGPIDSHGKNTLAYMQEFLAHAKIDLTY